MVRKFAFYVTAFFLITWGNTFAQNILKKAELQYESGAYVQALESYKSYLTENPGSVEALTKTAELQDLLGNLKEAEMAYEKLCQLKNVSPEVFLKYGHVLRKSGKLQDAKNMYNKYALFNSETGAHFALSCDFATYELSQPMFYDILQLPLNSTTSDFGLTFYHNFPVFSSFRKDVFFTEFEKENNQNIAAHRTFIYNDQKKKSQVLRGISGLSAHLGPVSFSRKSNVCTLIESVNAPETAIAHMGKKSVLYIASLNDQGEIIESKAFKYNEVGSNINSASLAFDGTALYFSSDRKGGYGGYDIWVSYLNDGEWGIPQNLGPNINTTGNEITPFFDDHTLYFASDFHIGMGGYDIFSSKVSKGKWQIPVNLGNGVNSIADDYFPCIHNNEIYFTSNRLGGKGSNDIYKATGMDSSTDRKQNQDITAVVPKAVSLEKMTEDATKNTVEAKAVKQESKAKQNSSTEVVMTAFEMPDFAAIKTRNAENVNADFSLAGARRISLDFMAPEFEVFFIQLASMSALSPNYSPFKSLVKYGNIYRINSNKTVKIRLGYYSDRKEAEDVLKLVKANGFKDAFITFEQLNASQMELILSSVDAQNYTDNGQFNAKTKDNPANAASTSKITYKVRLASYEDPIWFDVNKVKDIGRVEQWTKGNWTIFILAGYNNIEEAKQAQIKAINRGFNTAEVVIDNGGILERIKQN
jgi:tetratricopeptide (TPR) repeat protein